MWAQEQVRFVHPTLALLTNQSRNLGDVGVKIRTGYGALQVVTH